jgi:hypothetical protein
MKEKHAYANPSHPALNPLMRKCAVHGKSKKAKRHQDKMNLRKGIFNE